MYDNIKKSTFYLMICAFAYSDGMEIVMKKLWEDFKKFIKRGNVVDMAVGVAVATAFTAIVTAFTKGFITPLLSLISNESELDEMKWVVREEITETVGEETVIVQSEVAFLWGPFVHAIINFLIVAAALFVLMRTVSFLSQRAAKIGNDVRDLLSDEDEKRAEEEARLKAEQEKAEAEAAALLALEEEARAKEEEARLMEEERIAREEKERLDRQEQLLTDIRDLLKNSNS